MEAVSGSARTHRDSFTVDQIPFRAPCSQVISGWRSSASTATRFVKPVVTCADLTSGSFASARSTPRRR